MRYQKSPQQMIGMALALLLLAGCAAPTATPTLLLTPEQVSSQPYWPTQGWRASTPEDQGFDSSKLADGLQALKEEGAAIDSLLIIRNGYVMLDAYRYPYDNTIPHDLASVTKSVMTTLIGIAADQGKLQLDAPMVSFFPDRTIANLDSLKQRVTVRHLAGNVNGMESGCYDSDESTLDTMRSQRDWVQAALDRKLAREPGTSFCYDSPGMHLLSAILQKATGMTALDFARQNLFEPLGIREVYWQADPQGYTDGWGDLFLKPRDAAKIGYLWLNGGIWEGKQIVSPAWVHDSVKALSRGNRDNYGYGWWVSEDSYYAYGRGGQFIKVYPSLRMIVVVTGGGIDSGQIDPVLEAGFVAPDEPLPANPVGVAKLDATLTALAQSTHAWPVGPLPDTAQTVSGKTYVFEPNAVDVTTVRLEFGDTGEATVHLLKQQGNEEIWSVGLDGKYHLSPDGRAVRGYWADPQTLSVEVFDIGTRTYRFHFDDDRVEIRSPELGLRLEGQIGNP